MVFFVRYCTKPVDTVLPWGTSHCTENLCISGPFSQISLYSHRPCLCEGLCVILAMVNVWECTLLKKK
uniref:Uncharacterized protein n=1 Tax=Anguilla anguilla TaxID=7936 RepID=A0A0E9WVV1_ANGAN